MTSSSKKQSQKIAATKPMERLLEILTYLRTHPDGCAWTKEQTHNSLVPHLIEEAYETAETIDKGQHDGTLRDELGDLLLQIVFHAEIAREAGRFGFDDVAQAIVDKLERRYPTILGDEPNTLKTPEEIDRRWEEIKAEERRQKGIVAAEESILDEISTAMPALVRASKVKGRAAKAGWEWPDVTMLLDKIVEEVDELRAEISAGNPVQEKVAAEFGDLMFLMVDFARLQGIDAEDALRITTNRIERRIRHVESGLKKIGKGFKNATIPERRALWDEAKKKEKES